MVVCKVLIFVLFLEISLFKSSICSKIVAPKIQFKDTFLTLARHRVNSLTFPESLVSKKLRQDGKKESWNAHYKHGRTQHELFAFFQSGLYDSNLLKMIAVMTRAENILDIGLFTGLSAAAFLDSPHVKQVISLEFEPFLSEWVSSRTNLTENGVHKIMIGDSMESLKKLAQAGKKFDLIYLDLSRSGVDKHIEEYEFILSKEILGTNGVLLIHTRDKVNESRSPQILAKMNGSYQILNHVKEDERVDQVFIVDPSRGHHRLSGYLIVFPKVSRLSLENTEK